MSWSLFVDPAGLPEAEGTPLPAAWLTLAPLDSLPPALRAGMSTRIVSSVIVIIGVAYFAVFLALIVDAVQAKMKQLKQGAGQVVERDHTVVLGWTDETVTIVREIALANASLGGGCVAILSDRKKSQLEAELAAVLKPRDLHGTRVVFRTGSRLRAADLRKVATETARSVVVVSDGRLDPHAADAEVLQVVLNLATLRLRRANVVAEVRVSDNEVLLHLVSQGTVSTVPSHDLCGALMLQFARQPGLARVYSTVLGFEHSEFYVRHWPELEGRCFGDLAALLPAAVPIGVVADDGTCVLNPPIKRLMQATDMLVVLAEDDDSYSPQLGPAPAPTASMQRRIRSGVFAAAEQAANGPTSAAFVPLSASRPPEPERVLFAGWRRDIPSMMMLLDRLVAPGSELHIVCPLPVEARLDQIAEAGVSLESLRNLTLVHHVANSAVRRHLEALPIEGCTCMVIAADASAEGDVIHSDSHALATLLLVRGIQAARRRRALMGSYSNLAASAAAAVAAAHRDDAIAESAAAAMPRPPSRSGMRPSGDAPPAEEASTRGAPQKGSSGFAAAATARAGSAGHGVAFHFSGDVITSAADLPIVVEILDSRTQRTVNESTSMGLVSDFMQSNDLVSKILAMVSEAPIAKSVLDQLLGGTGTQFSCVPSEQYVEEGAVVSFAELAAYCSEVRSCVLCGFIEPAAKRRAEGGPAQRMPACVMNPPDKGARHGWEGYTLVVIAVDERLVSHPDVRRDSVR